MLIGTNELLRSAQEGRYAVGAFNVYNLEGVRAVVAAAEEQRSPAMLQLHPAALRHGGPPFVAMCLEAARQSSAAVGVHLDHGESLDEVRTALDAGLTSIMADGSTLVYEDNVAFTQEATALSHARGGAAEAELGRLSGTEDDVTVPENRAKLTDPAQAAGFVAETEVDALAVCIGNAHGRYRRPPSLDFARLSDIRARVSVPLVLHGASGLPEEDVRCAIDLGVCKLNVNTEVREAFLASISNVLETKPRPDLLELMSGAVEAMQSVVRAKLELFGSTGRAPAAGGGD